MTKIYAASLSDYNAGILHGAWIDAAQEADAIHEEIAEMLAQSPTARHEGMAAEEFAIHDHEGFGKISIGEFESIETVAQIAALLSEHPAAVVRLALADVDIEGVESWIDDRYAGEYKVQLFGDAVDAVADYLGDMYEDHELPDWARDHYDAILKEMARSDINGGAMHAEYEGLGVYHLVRTA